MNSDIANPLAEFCCSNCSDSVVAMAGNENGYGMTPSFSVVLALLELLLLELLLLLLLLLPLLQLVLTADVLLTFLNALFDPPPSDGLASITSATSTTSLCSRSSFLFVSFSTVPVKKATSKLRFGADWLFSTVMSIVILFN